MRPCTVARCAALIGLLALAACSRPRAPVPVLAGVVPEGLEAFLGAHPLAPGQPVRVDPVGRTPAASFHVAQIGTAEAPHRHQDHDLAVFVLQGQGVLTLDGQRITLRAGDAALIARGRAHWFARQGPENAVSFVVFTPPLDAPDTVPETGVDSRQGGR
jgi:quercetin dioxygenase-like cupin family protein